MTQLQKRTGRRDSPTSQSRPSPLYSMTRSRGQTGCQNRVPRDGHNFQGGTKDRECPPRYLVSLRKYPQLRDPAGGPGAAVQSRSQVPLVFYTGQGGAVSLWAWNTLLRGAGKPPACLGKARAAGIRWQSHSDLTHSRRRRNGLGIPSTLRVDMLGAGGGISAGHRCLTAAALGATDILSPE